MTTIDTVAQMVESTKAALAQVESQKAAIITNTQGAEDEAALVEWATLDTRARFLARYLEHLEGPTMSQAKAERIAILRAEFVALYPHHLDLTKAVKQAHESFVRLKDMQRMPSNEHIFIQRAQEIDASNAAYRESQEKLLPLRDEILSLGGVVELPI